MGEQWRRFREKLRQCDPVGPNLDGSEILPIVVGEATRWIRLDKLVQIARGLSQPASPAPPLPVPSPLPPGTILATVARVPAGWLVCDGRTLSRLTYPTLFAAIGTAYGADDDRTFKLPEIKTRLTTGKAPDVSWIIAT